MFDKIDEIAEKLKPMLEAVSPAKDKAVVAIVGATKAGKSSLVNYMNGSRYSPKNNRGSKEPQLIPGSKEVVCRVSSNIASSETFYPQVVQLPAEDFVICDLGGFFDSRPGIEGALIGISPHLLSSKASAIKGIIWVITYASFKEIAAQTIREMLPYFLKISKGNTELLVDSLSIVVTKGKKSLTQVDVISLFEDIIEEMHNDQEKMLLQSVVAKLYEQQDKIVIHNPYDNGESAQRIKQAINTCKKPHSPNVFNFSQFNKDQETFNQCLDNAAQLYVEKKAELKTLTSQLQQTQNQIQMLHQGQFEEQNQQVLGYKNRIAAINADYEQCHLTSTTHEMAINMLLKNTQEFVVIGDKEVNIPPQTLVLNEKTDVANGTADKAVRKMAKWWNEKNNDNWDLSYKFYGGKKSKFQYFATKTIPAPGDGFVDLTYPQTFPVYAEFNKDVTLKSEFLKTNAGYQARVEYKVGSGCNFIVTYKTLKQYTQAFIQELEGYQTQKEQADRRMSQLRIEKVSLEKLINDKQGEKCKTDVRRNELQGIEAGFKDEITMLEEEFKEHNEFFQSVCDITRILDLAKSYKAIEQLESYFPKAINNNQVNRYCFFDEAQEVNQTTLKEEVCYQTQIRPNQ